MKFKLFFLIGIMLCTLTGCKNSNLEPVQKLKDISDNNIGQDVQTDNSVDAFNCDDMEYKFDIEKVFHDIAFSSIIEGENVPVEIKYGMGGEGGYRQYSTKDTKIINEYIEAFKEIKIKEAITNQDDMIVVHDGIEDYIFILEDGTEIVVGTDCSTYVRDSDIEYVLENNERLFELNKLLQGY